jgi:hypothetical protein
VRGLTNEKTMRSRPSSSSSGRPEREGCFDTVSRLLEQTGTSWAVAGALAALEYRETGARGHVLTVEDVLVHKLIAWRPRDRDDVRSILSTGLDFNREYVDHRAAEWAVEDRWHEALSWRA